ncbi:Outer membrane porin protein 32 [Polaromonas vacuolata]|uniref:Outer membrane porin protein 32 n=1 Tax=Polaromonas vacuolata TaxID=37448 RepID=A0A6H2HCU5_9BURK|nr:porin [Polaromonas vacuolata]QJC57692.1 Outer membrane porin protein 32 [Polaromonas vacuolata]
MKKILTAFGVLLVTGSAFAQSSVTLFGVVDTAFSYGSGSTSNMNSISSSGNASSRFGFRGIEDLGGGLKAGFWLEGAIAVDTGSGGTTNINNSKADVAGLFGRRSTVSLIGNLGEVRIGRDYTANYLVQFTADPFGSIGTGASQVFVGRVGGATAIRASNMVGYFTPDTLGGFKGQAQYFFGENSTSNANRKNGDGYSLSGAYTIDSFYLAVGNGTTKDEQTTTFGEVKNNTITASYKIDNGKISAGYAEEKVNMIKPVKASGYILSGIYRHGLNDYKASISTYRTDILGDPKTNKFAIGIVHSLSKRSVLYGTLARVSNNGGAAISLNRSITEANQSSTGIDLGIRHSF